MKKIISFLLIAAGLMISAQTKAENTVSLTIDETVTEYATLEDAVAAAELAGKGLIQLLPAYSETAYPQAWVTDCTIEGPAGFDKNVKSFYTFHAYNPNNDDERIGDAKAAGTLSDKADIDRFADILKEVDPAFDSTGVDIPNFSMKKLNGYADWHADFEVFFDTDIKKEDYTIAGNYADYGWIAEYNQEPLSADLTAYQSVRLIQSFDNNLKYWELLDKVRSFHCGIISLNDTLNAGKTYFVNLYLYAEGNEDIKILVKSTRFAFPAIVDEQYKVEVDPAVVEGKSEVEVVAVEKLINSSFAEEGNNVDEATAGYGEENDKFIEVKLDAADVTVLGDSANAVTTSVFDVKPMMTVISGEDTTYEVIPNKEISSPITFRLPVDEALIGKDVKVSHKGESDPEFVDMGTFFVEAALREDQTISGGYVELSSKEFSLFKIEYKAPAALFEAKAAMSAKKAMVNGQLVIVKDGKMYNAQGVAL